jgi:protein-tyrosine-phosphatase
VTDVGGADDVAGAGVDEPVAVLVVCTANVARSPLFAAMLQARLGAAARVTSAGTRAREGDPAAEGSQVLAERRGLDLDGHRSRPVVPELVTGNDLVLTMSERQRDRCSPLAPRAASKVFTVRELARLADVVDQDEAPGAPAARLRWLTEHAHLARPRSFAPPDGDDVADPIRAPWEEWEAMASDFDDLLDRIAPAR